MPNEPIQVVVVAPYPAVRAGLRAMVQSGDGIEVVGELTTGALSDSAWVDGADVLVIDLDDEAATLLPILDELLPRTPAVLIAIEPADYRAPVAGRAAPRAYLLRQAGAEELVAAVRAVARGLIVLDPAVASAAMSGSVSPVRAGIETPVEPLTDREMEVLRLLALGLPNKGIALRLAISEHTVKFHVGAILAKLGAAGRTEAVMLAARRGLLPL